MMTLNASSVVSPIRVAPLAPAIASRCRSCQIPTPPSRLYLASRSALAVGWSQARPPLPAASPGFAPQLQPSPSAMNRVAVAGRIPAVVTCDKCDFAGQSASAQAPSSIPSTCRQSTQRAERYADYQRSPWAARRPSFVRSTRLPHRKPGVDPSFGDVACVCVLKSDCNAGPFHVHR
jgi:hypothetical protein